MSKINRDNKNRRRSVTIAFRVSPEENEDLNMRVKLSGLTKQDYITRRCQERDIVVVGNPRVYKALKDQMSDILETLKQLASVSEISDDVLETIRMVDATLRGLRDTANEDKQQ